MSKLAFITHPIYLSHNSGTFHPENKERLIAIQNKLYKTGLNKKITFVEPEAASEEIICMVHDNDYVVNVKEKIENGVTILDQGDTVVCQDSYYIACHAAGAALTAVDLIKSQNIHRAFCAVRPPGHHAEINHAKGFCIFNNIAIAVKYAQKIGLAKNILIIDWDVHHGNGLQHAFETDNSVFYYSIHQYPFFPGTGTEAETGKEEGKGFTFNRPMKSGSTDSEYLPVFENDIKKIKKEFNPDLIFLSAGFDAHEDDPLAGMRLTENGYKQMTKIVSKLSWNYCDGKIISVLEGGYDLDALASSVVEHLEVLLKY